MPLLTLEGVSLHFGGVKALSDMNLSVEAGSLHGLIGPNGAGKTTAMNVVSGLYRPQAGTVTFRGEPFRPKPHELASLGLARAFQAAAVIGSLTALENVLLGAYSWTRTGVIGCALRLPGALREERAVRARAEEALAAVGFAGDRSARLAELSTWQRRQVELARATLSRPRLLLLDEPAAGLTGREVEDLKALVRRIVDDGRGESAVLLVEHNVPLVFSLCDTVTAMAEGHDIAHGAPAAVRQDPQVIRSYLGAGGSTEVATVRSPPQPRADAETLLRLEGVASGYGPNVVINDISLAVRAGETVAIFGPNGAGKTTLFNTIVGERRPVAGRVTWKGREIRGRSIESVVRLGIGIVPQGRAVMERQSVDDNLLISATGLGLSSREFRDRLDETYMRFPALGRRRTSYGASLSGGERQMLALAKALIRRPSLLLLDEPSIGLAPTIVDEMQRIVASLSASGLAVMIGEQSVGWVVPIATRAYAIAAGRIVAEGSAADLADASALAERYLGAGEAEETKPARLVTP